MADAARIQRDIEHLKEITECCECGTTRIGFTETYRRGAEYFRQQLLKANLTVWEDVIGNVYGRREGTGEHLPAILSGSHLDTVRCAGAYDGIAGAVCALEAARMLDERNVQLKHPYEVMGIIEEEGTRFGQVLLGSKFACGVFGDEVLDEIKDPNTGVSLREILSGYALPDARTAYRKDDEILAFLELHDEQGPALDAEHIDIGIVENIVAISWLTITVAGFAGHAGTVPMPYRQDAAMGACRLIDRLMKHTSEHYRDTATATVGRLKLMPDSTNCIPYECVFTVDLRSGQMENIDALTAFIKEQAQEIERECQVQIQVNIDSRQQPVAMDKNLRQLLGESCEKLGFTHKEMNSGAGHDSMIFASRWPTAMLFIPCEKGITHNPLEFVAPEALAKGADALYQTIIELDKQSN